MLRNYLVVAIRNILRHKVYSAINIVGLSIGLAFCVVALMSVRKESGWDSFHERSDQIYRVIRATKGTDGSTTFRPGTSGLLAESLRRDLPEVLESTRLHEHKRGRMIHGDRKFDDDTLLICDLNLFRLFDFAFVRGDTTDLIQPYTIALTESTAKRFFGEIDPIGKVITRDARYYKGDFKVVAIVKDAPKKSSIQFDFITGTKHLGSVWSPWPVWQPHGHFRLIQTYVVLPRGYEPDNLEQKFPDRLLEYLGSEVATVNSYHLQPLRRMHLFAGVDFGMRSAGNLDALYMISCLGAFILAIACVNYMNLATARHAGRAREVGLRKVMGAQRGQLSRQFLVESVTVALLSLLLAIWCLHVIVPLFLEFDFSEFDPYSGLAIPGMVAVTVLVGALAGSYPAFFLSAPQPAEILHGARKGGGKPWLRRSLVVSQFAISTGLLVATLIVASQRAYMMRQDVKYDTENILVSFFFGKTREFNEGYRRIKAEFLAHPNILEASASNSLPGFRGGLTAVTVEGAGDGEWQMDGIGVDEDFIDLYGLELIAGRGFSPDIAGDLSAAYILNETAVQALGWDEPIGKGFHVPDHGRGEEGWVIGVVKDFHARSLHDPIEPLYLGMMGHLNFISLKLRPEDMDVTLQFVREKWYEYMPDYEFEYTFFDDRLREFYEEEAELAATFGYYAGLAVFIACLGLLGLAAYLAEQRTREVGIRKALGATVSAVVMLLSGEFVKLVLIANVIAWPLVLYLMDDWLNEFAFRIDLGPTPFVVGGVAAFAIAAITVGLQALKAALADPIEALRYE